MGLRKFFKRHLGLKSGERGDYWECYNRARFVGERVKKDVGEGARVLDVGGVNSNNLLKNHGLSDVTTLNTHDADLIATAEEIPCGDSSFDVVTCVDTLEHIPNRARPGVVGELLRVASKMVIIVAPLDSPENNRAEEIVLKYLSSSFVKDHRVQGLVDFAAVGTALKQADKRGRIRRMTEHDLDNLLGWVLMMVGDKKDVSDLYQEIYFLENGFFPRRRALCAYLF